MDESIVVEALYEKYIAPTKKKREKYIGIEIEIPIINFSGEAVDFNVVHKLTDVFAYQFQMVSIGVDDEGHTYSLQNNENGDNLSYDCSYNNLEFSMGKERDINVLEDRFKTYYLFANAFLNSYNHTLTGMGINPYRKSNRCVPIKNERYRMLFHYLGQYKNHSHSEFFHQYPDFGTFSSASQVQIDVEYGEVVDIINIFSKIEPIKALLFSNSVMPEDEKGVLCVRDMLWENSMHGINLKNIGMFEQELKNQDDLFEYIKQTSIYCTMRNGRYIDFAPIPVLEYFGRQHVKGERWNGTDYEPFTIEPNIEDLKYLRTFKFEDLTFRGTIEFRSCCCQPIADSMTVAAFHIGLIQTIDKLKILLDNDSVLYGYGITVSELRKKFCRGEIPEYVNVDGLQKLVLEILDLAKEGLDQRGFGEAHFLDPLFRRAWEKKNPALEYLQDLTKGVPLNELIQRYGHI